MKKKNSMSRRVSLLLPGIQLAIIIIVSLSILLISQSKGLAVEVTQTSADFSMPTVLSADPGTASALQAQARCTPTKPPKGIAQLSWKVAKNTGREQQVAVTVFRDGFEKGNVQLSPPLPPNQSSLEWDQVNGQAIHFWRVLTLQPEGWVASETARFEGSTCVMDFMPAPPKPSR